MRVPFTGVGTALVTPFTASGALDEPAIRRLTRRQVEAGIHVLVPCGTTGETPTLSADERRRTVELVVEENAGRALVLAGAGGYDTREVIQTVVEMARCGADGIRSVTPYYNRPTPEGLFEHCKAIADSTSLPSCSTTCPAAPLQHRSATVRGFPEIPTSWREGSVRQHHANGGDLPRRAESFRALRGRCDCPATDGAWRPRRDLVASNVVPADGATGRGRRARRFRRSAAMARLPLMQVNFIESSPGPSSSP